MDVKYVKLISEAGEELGLDVEARHSYSGRGMYGESTSAIVGNLEDIVQAIAQASFDIGHTGEGSESSYREGNDFIKAVGSIRLDNMGRSMIVY